VLGGSRPNLEFVTMRVYVTNAPRSGLNNGGKVGPCSGSRRRWVLDSGHAVSQVAHAANTKLPRFPVRIGLTREAYKERDTYMYVYICIYICEYIHRVRVKG